MANIDLTNFSLTVSSDSVKTDLELVHDLCGAVVCDAEAGDSLDVLVGMADDHVCALAAVDYKANARSFLANFLSDDCPADLDAFAREEYANDDPKTRDKTQTFYAQAIRTLGKPKSV